VVRRRLALMFALPRALHVTARHRHLVSPRDRKARTIERWETDWGRDFGRAHRWRASGVHLEFAACCGGFGGQRVLAGGEVGLAVRLPLRRGRAGADLPQLQLQLRHRPLVAAGRCARVRLTTGRMKDFVKVGRLSMLRMKSAAVAQ